MAFDLSSLSDDAFDAEYHRRLANKTPGEAGQKIAQTALISMGGNEIPSYPPRSSSTDVSNLLPKTPTAQFIGQRGEVFTAPNQDISQSYIDKRGNVRPTVIDARAPVSPQEQGFGRGLSTDADWRAKFQPSSQLQQLINQGQTSNAASRVNNPGYNPVTDITQKRADDAQFQQLQQQGVYDATGKNLQPTPDAGPKIASQDEIGSEANDPFRKFFGGGIQAPTPTPTPSPPPKIADDTPYWRKKQEDDNAYA